MKEVFNIEVRECGVWNTVDTADNFLDAVYIASSLTQNIREEWIRILDWNNKEL